VRVAIVGSRDYQNKIAVINYVCDLPDGTVVVSGGARGVDSLAIKMAEECGLSFVVFYADWSLGKKAGPLRNQKIVDHADRVVAFHDGVSRGTRSTIDMAIKAGKPVRVIGPDGEATHYNNWTPID
jgi:hypothetical protein